MMNQNKEYEDMPVKEKKKKQELREAGMDVNGEFSMDSLKKWFRRAGGALSICAAAVCLMAVLMMGKNRKESLIMEVNSDIMMEFTMNRRGSVLSAKGMMARSNEAVSMTVFEGKSLGIAVGKIFDRLADNNSLGEDGGILISVRKSGAEVKASPEKIVKELQKQTESELQKKESRATVYVFESEEDTKTTKPKTTESKTAEPGTTASETVPPETAPPTAPETTAAVTETTAASGMLTPETKTPAYLRGPGFEDPDNPKNQN